MILYLTELITQYGLLGIFVFMTLESALVPIPSEITMPFGGFLSGLGIFNFWTVVFVGAIANLFGSLIAYWLGYLKGDSWVRGAIKRWGKFLLIKVEEYDKATRWFKNYGSIIAFTSRLMPIVRTYISLPAGISKMNIYIFSIYTFLGSLIWSAFLAFLGLKLGENWPSIEPYFRSVQTALILGFLAAVIYFFYRRL